MLKKFFLISTLIFIIAGIVYTHGINYSLTQKSKLSITFTYEGGEPMKNATVLFFAPGNYNKYAFKKTTDNSGRVEFSPEKKGEWIIMAKQAGGHVKRVNLKVSENMLLRSSKGSLSFLQKIIIAFCVLWGFVGTALYFKSIRLKNKDN